MQYKIILKPTYTNTINVGLELLPDNEPLKFLISAFALKQLTDLINSANLEIGTGIEDHFIKYHSDLDGSDFVDGVGFEPDEVGFWVYSIGFGVLKKDIFFNILCDYVEVVLAYHKVRAELTEKMESDINRELTILKKKIGRE